MKVMVPFLCVCLAGVMAPKASEATQSEDSFGFIANTVERACEWALFVADQSSSESSIQNDNSRISRQRSLMNNLGVRSSSISEINSDGTQTESFDVRIRLREFPGELLRLWNSTGQMDGNSRENVLQFNNLVYLVRRQGTIEFRLQVGLPDSGEGYRIEVLAGRDVLACRGLDRFRQ